jgi:hypothetical protein
MLAEMRLYIPNLNTEEGASTSAEVRRMHLI